MMMKIRSILSMNILVSFILLASCEEEEKGPLFSDANGPGIVTEVVTESLPGGARISYTLPPDDDLLLVRAEYMLPGGEKAVRRSSLFNDFIEIDGLIDSVNDHRITLIAEDRGGSESAPVTVDVRIEKAPIFLSAESLTVVPDFGGVRITWTNATAQPVTLRLFANNSQGIEVPALTVAREQVTDTVEIVRGFPSEPMKFKILFLDQWENLTDTVVAELTPFFEGLVPKNGMRDITLPGDISEHPPAVANGQTKVRMWDGITRVDGEAIQWFTLDEGGAARVDDPVDEYDLALGNPESHMITIDLGRSVKLSRFRYWGGTPYQFGDIRVFDLWGIDEDDESNLDGSLTGWTKLLSNAEVIKPSGQNPGTNSQEDLDKDAAGHEFVTPLGAPRVRFVRLAMTKNWIGGNSLVFFGSEFSFFGDFEQ